MVRPRSASLLFLALILSEAITPIRSVNYVNDELLWTKQTWDQYKLDFPWQQFAKREPAISKLLDSEAWTKTSLSGSLGNTQEQIDRGIKRGAASQPSRFDVSLLDEKASKAAAAEVAQCKVCLALASVLWRGLASWVNTHEAVPSRKRITDYATQLCEYEVPNEVLQEWVLLQARVQPSQKALYYMEEVQEFIMLSGRQKQHATPSEIAAVRLACNRLVQEDGVKGAKAGVVRQASTLLHRYYDHLEQRLGKAGGPGAPVEAVDEGPAVDPSCVDRHPQCKKWAAMGECAANPTFMVGDGQRYIGQCNRACGDCQVAVELQGGEGEGEEGGAVPPKPRRKKLLELSEEDSTWVASLASDLLSVLHSKACANAPPCAAAGAGMEQLLRAGGGEGGKEDGGKSLGGLISGPLQTKAPGGGKGAPQVDPQRMLNSKVIVGRESSDSFLPHQPPKKPRPAPPSRQLPTPAAKTLWLELGNQCLYITTGWWMYELCYWDSITQFHMGEDHRVDWVISLGRFDSASWEVHNTTEAGLYTPGTQVPFISHSYSQGNDCEMKGEDKGQLDGDEGRGEYQDDEEGEEYVDGDDDVEEEGRHEYEGEEYEEGGSGAKGGAAERGASVRRQGAGGRGGIWRGRGGGEGVIKRSSELRIMCSPDTELRIYVAEPEQCRYRVELYVPQLCRLEGLLVEGHELAGRAAAAAEEAQDT